MHMHACMHAHTHTIFRRQLEICILTGLLIILTNCSFFAEQCYYSYVYKSFYILQIHIEISVDKIVYDVRGLLQTNMGWGVNGDVGDVLN